MADYTTNLNLEKPVGNENFRRQVLNENMDKIDAAVTARETITGAQAKADAVQANLSSHLADSAAHGLGNGIQNSIPLSFGYNRIRHTGPVAILPEIEFTGQHHVNLLGKDGDCEDISKWSSGSQTPSLDSTNKVFGANSIKHVLLGSITGWCLKEIFSLASSNKYYMISGYIKNGNLESGGRLSIYANGTSRTIKYSPYVIDTTKFIRVCARIQPSDWGTGSTQFSATFNSGGTINQYAYFDGIMVNEISADDYALSDAELLDKYPYVESCRGLTNPMFENRRHNLVRNGNAEEGIGYWTPHDGGTISVVNNKIRVSGTTSGHRVVQRIKVKPNTNYTISANITPGTTTGRIQTVTGDDLTYLLELGVGTFNTGTWNEIIIYLRLLGNGYCDFDSIMLVEGTTAPSAYKSCDYKAFVPEGQLFKGDRVKIKDGAVSGQKWWKQKTLYGKGYDWQFRTDYTGFKSVRIPLSVFQGIDTNILFTTDLDIAVKYNGNILPHGETFASGDIFGTADSGTNFVISIKDSDSGWDESINPNGDEVKVFMNGWKSVSASSSIFRYLGWISVIDGSVPAGSINTLAVGTNAIGQKVINITPGTDNTKFAVNDNVAYKLSNGVWAWDAITAVSANSITVTTNLTQTVVTGAPIMKIDDDGITPLLNWCKNNVAPGYEGYKLYYKLANPEPITDINVPIKGNLWSLVPGDNYITVDSGIVLGEVANPQYSAGNLNWYINNYQFGGMLKYPYVDSIAAVYKNGFYDSSWAFNSVNDISPFIGIKRSFCPNVNYDPNATYTIDYQILNTLHVPVFGSLAMRYTQDVFTAVTSTIKALEERQQKNSILDTLIEMGKYEDIDVGNYYPSWVKIGSTITILIDVPYKVIKNMVPTLEIVTLRIYSNNVEITNKFTHSSISPRVKKDRVQFNMNITDSALVASIPTNGVNAVVRVKIYSREG